MGRRVCNGKTTVETKITLFEEPIKDIRWLLGFRGLIVLDIAGVTRLFVVGSVFIISMSDCRRLHSFAKAMRQLSSDLRNLVEPMPNGRTESNRSGQRVL